jgi:hypothetical protein
MKLTAFRGIELPSSMQRSRTALEVGQRVAIFLQLLLKNFQAVRPAFVSKNPKTRKNHISLRSGETHVDKCKKAIINEKIAGKSYLLLTPRHDAEKAPAPMLTVHVIGHKASSVTIHRSKISKGHSG